MRKSVVFVLFGMVICIGGIFLTEHIAVKKMNQEQTKAKTDASGQTTTAVTTDWVNEQIKTRTDKLDQMAQQLKTLNQAADAMKVVQFKDVPPSYFAYKHINYLSSKGIIKGYPAVNMFYPGRNVLRYQAAAMLIKAKGLTLIDAPSKFSDISNSAKDKDVREVAMTALENGLFKGVPQKDGTLKFEPFQPVTRQQMAAVINNTYNFNGQKAYSFTPFSDVPKKNGQYDAIKNLATYHIVKGKTDGTFDPGGKTTRGQFCIFLASAMNPNFRY